jgi:hypothetical protein
LQDRWAEPDVAQTRLSKPNFFASSNDPGGQARTRWPMRGTCAGS